MEIRELERLTINLVPELVFMESDTVLVQYIISSWSLEHRHEPEYYINLESNLNTHILRRNAYCIFSVLLIHHFIHIQELQ